jgi:hypothetical protein
VKSESVASKSASARSSAAHVGKGRWRVERPTFAADASSPMVTCRSPSSIRAARRMRWRLASASEA